MKRDPRIVLELHVEEDGDDVGAMFQELVARLEVEPKAAGKLLEMLDPDLTMDALGSLLGAARSAVDRAQPRQPLYRSAFCASDNHVECPKNKFAAVPCACACHPNPSVPLGVVK